jgi:hypothetical protein
MKLVLLQYFECGRRVGAAVIPVRARGRLCVLIGHSPDYTHRRQRLRPSVAVQV